VKRVVVALALCAAVTVIVLATGKPLDPGALRVYQDARKDYDQLLSDCARVSVMSEEYRIMCQELPQRRPVAPH
jgi:hypothetical protein